ncbi:membrane protein [Pleomassaria siparia CBS 279.74]|uniref:Membrane protein n=1 Tax=Pleomassaria siparia CBS 279.74 TaxID=1314801 RepID=A0A6G1KSM8_9PLEO|nr:membrane protein [Pleomassaria siparia CBS 279.74]
MSSAGGIKFQYGEDLKPRTLNTKSKQIIEGYFVCSEILPGHVIAPSLIFQQIGPRDIQKHSKWPRALRIHGSVTPKLIIPVLGVTCWTTLVVVISEIYYPIAVHPIVITVLGLVVGLALNFRSSTAYERYMDGRRAWSWLGAMSQNLARVIWIHAREREDELGKQDLMAKVACLNLIIAFAVSLKHKLRFQPYTQYDDLNDLVGHLDTFSKAAGQPSMRPKNRSLCKKIGELFSIPMARSNPRKELKRAKRPLGNLPLEILSFISAYVGDIIDNGTFPLAIAQTQALNTMQSLNEILGATDRVLNTPLPIAYQIAISQMTWMYIITLPFQLVQLMGWAAIPVTIFAAYIILGIAAIGHEIENPFGPEVNDLPMELYCAQIASDVTVIASKPPARARDHYMHTDNKPLYPFSSAGYEFWLEKSEKEIRDALRTRASISEGAMCQRQASCAESEMTVRGDRDEEENTGEVSESVPERVQNAASIGQQTWHTYGRGGSSGN